MSDDQALEQLSLVTTIMPLLRYNDAMGFLLYIWQLPQNIIGYALSRRARRIVLGDGSSFYLWHGPGSVSLGEYIIVSSPGALGHELGHRKQSRMLGPLYLLVIGLPSLAWCILHTYTPLRRLDYYGFYTEAWAERIRRGRKEEL